MWKSVSPPLGGSRHFASKLDTPPHLCEMTKASLPGQDKICTNFHFYIINRRGTCSSNNRGTCSKSCVNLFNFHSSLSVIFAISNHCQYHNILLALVESGTKRKLKESQETQYIFFITDCIRNDAEVSATGQLCGNNCSTAADCRRNRPCVCDGACGLSCINTCKLQARL